MDDADDLLFEALYQDYVKRYWQPAVPEEIERVIRSGGMQTYVSPVCKHGRREMICDQCYFDGDEWRRD